MTEREMTNEEVIDILGGIRACYNIFDEYDEPKYAALSRAIVALKAEPTRHGHWIRDERFWHCSVCNECSSWVYKYCPHCGAKMEDDK